MQKLYMLISKEKLYLYEKDGEKYRRQYIEGNPEYRYELKSASDYINRLLEILKNEYNLDSVAELEFIVLDNENEIYSQVLAKALGEYVVQRFEIGTILSGVMRKLNRDKNLRIAEFGINFDGKNYKLKNDKPVKNEFSLLGYTIREDDIMRFIG